MSTPRVRERPRRRRWCQFSLRTLLLVMVACCVALALGRMYLNRFRDQQEAVQAIRKLGAWIEMRPGGPDWLREMLGDERFMEATCVKLEGRDVDDEDLRCLRKLVGLRRLYLANTRTGDRGLAHVAGLTKLERMSLWRTDVTDAGMAHLRRLRRLEALDLHNTRVTDAGLAPLRESSALGLLDLSDTKISSAGLRHVAQLRHLRVLDLDGTQVNDEALVHLKGLKNLVWLGFRETQITLPGERALDRALPNLEIADGVGYAEPLRGCWVRRRPTLALRAEETQTSVPPSLEPQ